jgi:hypothetical protein
MGLFGPLQKQLVLTNQGIHFLQERYKFFIRMVLHQITPSSLIVLKPVTSRAFGLECFSLLSDFDPPF